MRMPKPADIVPVDKLVAMLDEFGTAALKSVHGQGMLRLMNTLEAKAVELAPALIGNLEDSTVIRVDEAGDTVRGYIAFVTPYASRVHELPQTTTEWGEQTLAKPGNEYGRAGAKYLERPLRGFQQGLGKGIAKFLQEVWGDAKAQKGGRRG